ncbi:hypothetical protein [Sphaerisporangium fuscum]|uniref:hypothetical protein n=1 Tax=Sphaerisporangium fuscum TaxID=2835868 RepID=UPI001BDC67F1|nr:hypothetical protein [Sphaerisporangium fuscum]
MLVILAVAALAVLYCVVMVSQGRGGELAEFAPDVPPLDLPAPGQLTAADFMALHLPVSLVGYHTQSVDETLQRAATAIGERDTHIAVLEQRVAELLAGRLQARQAYPRPSWAPVANEAPPSQPAPSQPVAAEPVVAEPETGPGDSPEGAFDAFAPVTPPAPKTPGLFDAAATGPLPAVGAGEDPFEAAIKATGQFEAVRADDPAESPGDEHDPFEPPAKERDAFEKPADAPGERPEP